MATAFSSIPGAAMLASAAVNLQVNDAIIDGEVVVQDAKGRSWFGDLQEDIAMTVLIGCSFSPSIFYISTALIARWKWWLVRTVGF